MIVAHISANPRFRKAKQHSFIHEIHEIHEHKNIRIYETQGALTHWAVPQSIVSKGLLRVNTIPETFLARGYHYQSSVIFLLILFKLDGSFLIFSAFGVITASFLQA